MREFRLRRIHLLAFVGRVAWSSGKCINNIEDIYEAENQVQDIGFERTYVLCPRSIYDIGYLDVNFGVTGFKKSPPLPIRPNMRILCGDSGNRDELCWIADGDVQMDATNIRGITDESVENVLIQGFTFIGAKKHALWASKPGNITFRDCEFREFKNSTVPVLLDWFDGTDSKLSVTFENCWFHDNRYFGWGSNTALIYGNSAQNSLTVRSTIFSNNDMTWNNTLSATNSFIIETLGPLTVEESCFKDNNVGVSNVVVFGNQLIDTRNYVQNSNGTLCGFASVFENLEQFDRFSPICVGATERGCQASTTPQPTTIPSAIPTGYPTFAPTKASSHAPTPVSSQQPSMIPADTPSLTKYPTGAPTRSHAPSTEPPNQGRDVTSSANTFYSSALSTLLLGCVYYLLL